MEGTVYLVLTTLFVSSLVRSSLGFGDALVAMPLLTLFVPLTTATPLVALLSTSMAVVILIQDFKSIDFGSTWRLSFGAAIGIPLGAALLTQVDAWLVKSLLAVIVFSFSVFRLVGPELGKLENDRWAPMFGFASGFLGGAYNTFGPPIVIFGSMRKWQAETYRVSVQGFYLPVCAIVLSVHFASGLWQPVVFRYFAAALPIVFLATFIGRSINQRLGKRGGFDRVVYVALIVVAFVLLYGALHTPPEPESNSDAAASSSLLDQSSENS